MIRWYKQKRDNIKNNKSIIKAKKSQIYKLKELIRIPTKNCKNGQQWVKMAKVGKTDKNWQKLEIIDKTF